MKIVGTPIGGKRMSRGFWAGHPPSSSSIRQFDYYTYAPD